MVMGWYRVALEKYAVFEGRSGRAEYWIFNLVNWGIAFVLGFVEAVTGLPEWNGLGPLSTVFALAVLIPSFTVFVRRLHDTDRSGWWILISLVPVLGALVLFVFALLPGNDGQNEYGPVPGGLPA